MSVCRHRGESGGQGRAWEGAPDSSVSPTAKPEATDVSPNKGILSVTDDFAQEVPWTDLDSRALGEARAGGPRVLGHKVGGGVGAGLPHPGGGEGWGPGVLDPAWRGLLRERGPRVQSPGRELRAVLFPPQIATCHSRNGNPVPQITWYRNGEALQVPMEMNAGARRRRGLAGRGWVGGWRGGRRRLTPPPAPRQRAT